MKFATVLVLFLYSTLALGDRTINVPIQFSMWFEASANWNGSQIGVTRSFNTSVTSLEPVFSQTIQMTFSLDAASLLVSCAPVNIPLIVEVSSEMGVSPLGTPIDATPIVLSPEATARRSFSFNVRGALTTGNSCGITASGTLKITVQGNQGAVIGALNTNHGYLQAFTVSAAGESMNASHYVPFLGGRPF